MPQAPAQEFNPPVTGKAEDGGISDRGGISVLAASEHFQRGNGAGIGLRGQRMDGSVARDRILVGEAVDVFANARQGRCGDALAGRTRVWGVRGRRLRRG